MTIASTHAELVEVIAWIDANLSGIEFPIDERSMLSVGCLDVALEHQAAISILHQAQLHGSMLALLRVLTESLVRGLWLLHCASDAELSRFKKGEIDKKFGQLIEEVETHLGNINGTLSTLKTNAWKAMNGFTHTGFNQVVRRHGEGRVCSNYPETDISQALLAAGALGLIAAGQLAGIADRTDLLEAALRRMNEYATSVL